MDGLGISTHLGTGEAVYLRPIGRQDRAREVEIISRLSAHSRYLRFFTGAATVPDRVIDQLVNTDGYHHIAWGALELNAPGAPLMGVVHAIRRNETCEADLALAVLDAHHAKGLARLLMAAVVHQALAAGITRLSAETLHENGPARRLFKAIGGKAGSSGGLVITYGFDTATVAERLAAMDGGKPMDDLRGALERMQPLPKVA
ncbi:MAG: GNAT family N-acetyltransferase [Hyphomonas sp.]|uniref:GNAT family N-acetyltransferase n=1 Tax=Hyphomonas sp. TaxID=87 RepID=UPI00183FF45A|nr:GNAT family N-acetyltransferase [Hyphomonas sp.]MBU3921849.1 GNAT family N-acetyltransferase [Alphaproteobacteria bacterium]MBA3069484.1 GNAT family N-acetyltransferase [Hyphomonas sp.]MBU4063866.1 GNAT family N-acetyltransferase [Alphaproteobacteria bacterium]MBU4164173.1 GNAT family N-acetyltransferase [Alphaproteobacteria bacterium]MBU4568138.1 GNAT family N-acetyltransferase [Alphaproteobacteria bacterium]